MIDPTPDRQTDNAAGERLDPLPAGVTFHDVTTQVDERGWICEMFDPRWGWHKDPLVFVYTFTVRPGVTKGWGIHHHHEDRYFILFGEMEVVLFDVRPDSPTRGLLAKVYLSEYRRRLMNIPAGVWHADRNVGGKDAVIVNFPTIQYDHTKPDKHRLPLDTDQIPHKFENPRGW